MLPLHRKEFPASKDELAQALENSLRQLLGSTQPLVSVQARAFPFFDEIAVNLDNLKLDSVPSLLAAVPSNARFACEAGLMTMTARNLRLRGTPLDVRVEARGVVFDQAQDGNDEVVLAVKRVREGYLQISVTQLDLEGALGEIARREGRKAGVAVENLRLAMRARGPRSVSADIRFQAGKFLLRARIDISARIDVDENLVARVFDLKCKGDGAVGSLACNAIGAHLSRLEGRSFPLKSLPLLGEVQLRDVRISVADTVQIIADFGSAAA
jgi:hypothetical protein